ncbi:type VI secretion system tube protein TssD [Bizionia paragorgiae]
MSIIAKLYIEEREINILKFDFSFNQNSDVSGRPSAKPTRCRLF